MNVCSECGASLAHRGRGAKTCSDACRSRRYRRLHRADRVLCEAVDKLNEWWYSVFERDDIDNRIVNAVHFFLADIESIENWPCDEP